MTLVATSPAYAISGPTVALSAPSNRVAASGGTPVTATVRDSTGAPRAGVPVSFTGPSGSSFSPSTATTNASGTATTTFDPRTPWAKPGSTVTVSAVSGQSSVSQGLSVAGANIVFFGDNSLTPTQSELVFPSPVVGALATGSALYNGSASTSPTFSAVWLQDGTVWTKGTNAYGELGDGTTNARSNWAPVPELAGVTQAAVGYGWVIAVRSDGSVVAWGRNAWGQMADGTTTDRHRPVAIHGLPSNVTQVSAASGTGLVRTSDGSIWSWGRNIYGEVGDGSTTTRYSPVRVAGLPRAATSLSSGYGSSYVVLSDGSLWAWGYNAFGQVGDGTTTDRLTPVQVTGLTSRVVQAVGSARNGYALLDNGSVKSWGNNEFGQLGNGTSANGSVSTPTQVLGLTTGVSAITAGGIDAHAVLADGRAKGWGSNSFGQVGNGSSTRAVPTPVDVLLPSGRSADRSSQASHTAYANYLIIPV